MEKSEMTLTERSLVEQKKNDTDQLGFPQDAHDRLIKFLHGVFGPISSCHFGFTKTDIKVMYKTRLSWRNNKYIKEIKFEGQTIPVEVRFCGPIRLCNT